MAGTLTRSSFKSRNGKFIEKLSVAFTSDASGNATCEITDMYGYIMKMVTDPGGTAPTDDYDITLVDEYGADALIGAGANRDTANSETVHPTQSGAAISAFVCGTHTLTIANAGDSKTGTVVLFVCDSL